MVGFFMGMVGQDDVVAGGLYTWGLAASGRLGNGTSVGNVSSPMQIGVNQFSFVGAGGNASYAIKDDGTLWAWGLGTTGQLGDSTTTNKSSPVQIGARTDWQFAEGIGSLNAVFLTSTGEIWTSGSASGGALGNGTSTPNQSSPVQVTGSWLTVAGGEEVGISIKSDGTLWGWGINNQGYNLCQIRLRIYGQSDPVLGVAGTITGATSGATATILRRDYIGGTGSANDYDAYYFVQDIVGDFTNDEFIVENGRLAGHESDPSPMLSPVQIGTNSNWMSVRAGTRHAAAITDDNDCFVFGLNTTGRLGLGDTTTRSSPTQLSGKWLIVTPAISTYGIKTDGTLWGWGLGTSGQLGQGNTTNYSSPVQIGVATNWMDVQAGGAFVLAINSDGEVWGCGLNSSGQIGDGTTTNRSSLVQVGALSSVISMACADQGSIAIEDTP